MRRIDLDYQRPRQHRSGLALFAAGCLAAAAVGYAAWQQGEAVAVLEVRLARIERPRPTAPASAARAADAAQAERLREARAVQALLDRPWSPLFQTIEAARDPDIALLGIEPDAGRGLVRITAEARRREAMLAYLDRLGQTPVLHDAILIEHQVQKQVAERPIRFSLSVLWEQSP